MNFQDFRNLQKAYKQVYSSQRLNEFGPGDSGGSLKVGRTFGGAPGTKPNTTVSGSASLGGSNVSGSLTQGTFSGQGDNTSQGVTNALNNLENPNSKLNTSTSTSTTGIRGELNANISGKIGSGVTPQDAARKRAMSTPAPATSPAQKPAPATPPATKLAQKPAPTTPPLARNMEAILKKKEVVGDPAPPLAQKPAPPLATQTRLRGFM
jgi:hypothetical protein